MKKILEICIWFLLAIVSCLYFSNLWISVIFLFFHELAHYVTGKLLGYNLKSISLLPFGMRFGFKEEFFNPWDDIVISISGPLINFLFFIFFLCINKYSSLFILLRNINLALCLFNILPASFLDGGRILKAIIANNLGIYKGHLISNINGIIVGCFILFLTTYQIHFSKGIMLILLSIFILYKSINNIRYITMNVINDILYKQNYTKTKKSTNIKISAFKADIKILNIIKNFCFNKYYVIYIIENGDLRYNINETDLIKLYYTYGNIVLGQCENYSNMILTLKLTLRRRIMVKISDEILIQVEKPARYTGGEVNVVMKNIKDVNIRFAMCFPDVYEVGMSHLGIKILYHKINERADAYCERAFAPWVDMENKMRENNVALFTLETKDPLSLFDFVGFTLQYEMSYTNIINMLDLAEIPLLSKDRYSTENSNSFPFIVFGGPCAYNPEPLADIADFFILGEAEEVIEEVLDVYNSWKASKTSRIQYLERISEIQGVYVPSFYTVTYNEDGTINSRIKTKESYKTEIEKRFIENLDKSYYPDKMLVPLTEIVHDRIVLETFRGCTRGCRFCQAGMIYRPVREKSSDTLLKQADILIKSTGYDEISLSSLSICDYSDIKNLIFSAMEKFEDKKVGISLPSIRIDSFSVDLINEIQKVRKTGLTFAPEAGSQRMRDIINKGVTEEDLLTSAKSAFEHGWSTLKLYFMIGLPFETMEDIEGIAVLSDKVANAYYSIPKDKRFKGLSINVSSSSFVPKPFTPFQWESQDSIEVLREKQKFIKSKLKSNAIKFNWHESYVSFLEGVFSRGDRRLSKVLIKAWEKGCKFDGWQEFFDFNKWMEAFKECGVDPEFYSYRKREKTEILPWDFIDIGVSKEYLLSELEKAEEELLTPDCRLGCTGCGMTKMFKDGECKSGAFIN